MRKQKANISFEVVRKKCVASLVLFFLVLCGHPVLFAVEPAASPAEEAIDETTLNKRLSLIEKRVHAVRENQKLILAKQPDIQSELQSLKIFLHRHRSGRAPASS